MLYGIIEYNNIKYFYRLKNDLLYLQHLDDFGNKVFNTELIFSPPVFDCEYLRGTDEETGNIVYFKILKEAGLENNLITLCILYYIELRQEAEVDKIVFFSNELDYIYNANKAVEEANCQINGYTSIILKSFSDTTTQREKFYINEKELEIYFSISRLINSTQHTIINLHTAMNICFEKTSSKDFLISICNTMERFLSFLCYRTDICFNKILLFSKNEKGIEEQIGEINLLKKPFENNVKVLERCITYDGISGNINKILQDISNGDLYLRHIPNSSKEWTYYDCAKIIMITAALERIFDDLYPSGVRHKESKSKALNEVKDDISKKIEKSSGNIKKTYKYLYQMIDNDPLSSKMVQMFNDNDLLIRNIGEFCYKQITNTDDFNYKETAKRIQDARNAFAHGRLYSKLSQGLVADIFCLEKVVYLLQLSKYNIDKEVIIKQVKKLFRLLF